MQFCYKILMLYIPKNTGLQLFSLKCFLSTTRHICFFFYTAISRNVIIL